MSLYDQVMKEFHSYPNIVGKVADLCHLLFPLLPQEKGCRQHAKEAGKGSSAITQDRRAFAHDESTHFGIHSCKE